VVLFSSYTSLPHRDPHPFPTRRSSDLMSKSLIASPPGPPLRDAAPAPTRSQDAPIPLDFVSGYAGGARRADHVAGTADRRLRWRSEEHTSELQSRFDLVCRLLLEKKKK